MPAYPAQLDDITGFCSQPVSRNEAFATTLWSLVLDAGIGDLERSAPALQRLCSIYWYPVYAFIRRRGSDVHEAEDLTQSFFAHVLEADMLQRANQDKGRFRSFLLGALTNFLNNESDKQRTLKRGGRSQVLSWDEAKAEGLLREEPAVELTPERSFDRRWAFALVEHVLATLRREYLSPGNIRLQARLEPFLTQEIPPGSYTRLSSELGMNPSALKVALHRLRRRFGELLRREVSQTVVDAASLDEELRYLLSVISC